MKNLLTNDVVVRALKTFVQAFFAALAISVAGVVDWNTGKAALLAAVSAGISAAWNAVLQAK